MLHLQPQRQSTSAYQLRASPVGRVGLHLESAWGFPWTSAGLLRAGLDGPWSDPAGL